MTVKDVIASCLIIALGTILALHFALFWLYGGVFIHESNTVILTIETVMSLAIFVFGIERLASSARLEHNRRPSTVVRALTKAQYATEYITSPLLPQGMGQKSITAVTAATMIPAPTALRIESDARCMDECTYRTSNDTGDFSDLFVHSANGDHEPTVCSEALRM